MKTFLYLILIALFAATASPAFSQKKCSPTSPDMLGPFYKPGAPVRASVGKGYLLAGIVKSGDCSAIKGAMIEFWLVGPDGEYDDMHRATIYADNEGKFSFESNYPKPYSGRPPHIHIRVSAPLFRTLVTQHYPKKNETGAEIELVLTGPQ
jgi:protocatechuate 3,4-dioxygenase beta subunit